MPRRGSLASPWWCWARSAGTTTTSGSPGRDTPGQYMPDVVSRIGAAAQEVIGLGARSCSSSRGTFRSGARRSTWACSGATPPRTTTSTVASRGSTTSPGGTTGCCSSRRSACSGRRTPAPRSSLPTTSAPPLHAGRPEPPEIR